MTEDQLKQMEKDIVRLQKMVNVLNSKTTALINDNNRLKNIVQTHKNEIALLRRKQ